MQISEMKKQLCISDILNFSLLLDSLLEVIKLTDYLETTKNPYLLKIFLLLGSTSFTFGTYYGRLSNVYSKIQLLSRGLLSAWKHISSKFDSISEKKLNKTKQKKEKDLITYCYLVLHMAFVISPFHILVAACICDILHLHY